MRSDDTAILLILRGTHDYKEICATMLFATMHEYEAFRALFKNLDVPGTWTFNAVETAPSSKEVAIGKIMKAINMPVSADTMNGINL